MSPSWRLTAILGRLDKRETQYSEHFLGYLADLDIWKDDGVRYLMSPTQRKIFLERYEQTNREVAEQYFPDLNGELFESLDIEDDHWRPVSIPSAEECECRVRMLWSSYSRKLQERSSKSQG